MSREQLFNRLISENEFPLLQSNLVYLKFLFHQFSSFQLWFDIMESLIPTTRLFFSARAHGIFIYNKRWTINKDTGKKVWHLTELNLVFAIIKLIFIYFSFLCYWKSLGFKQLFKYCKMIQCQDQPYVAKNDSEMKIPYIGWNDVS